MISVLRKNFKLANILVRILFVITFVFAHWQQGLTATLLVLSEPSWPLAIAVLAILGVVLMFLLPFFVNVLLGWSRIVSVPNAEFNLLAHAFCSVGFLLLGLLNLVNLFTPLALVWGGKLFPLVSTIISALLFYTVTSKLYFNDATRVHYFKTYAIFFLVFVVIIEVL